MSTMTPRELVTCAVRHEPTPRIPRDMWTLPWATHTYPKEVAAIQRDFPNDIIYPDVPYPTSDIVRGDRYAVGTYVDEWGCVFENLQRGVIGEVKHPLVHSYASDLDKVCPPAEWKQLDTSDVARQCAETDRFVLASPGMNLFERLQFLRGTEHLMMDLLDQPAGMFKMIERVHEWNLAMIDVWCATEVDALVWLDDWGSQRALLMNPDLWRQILKPLYRECADRIHAAGKLCFVHSDGYILDVYEDLIEIGVDAINSQLFCMDIEEIARRFKGRLCFWGEIDRQHILPFGTEQDARQAVRRVANALCDGHGGVIGQCEFSAGARPENVRAVFDEWDNVSLDTTTRSH